MTPAVAGAGPAGRVRHVFTDVDRGDLAVDGAPGPLATRRRAVVDLPWTWLRQVHGAGVVTVTRPGEHAGADADAAVTATPGAALAVHTADCAPVLLDAGAAFGVVHVGWRGLASGVLEAAVDALEQLGHRPVRAVLGPCIRPRCYEFGEAELDAVVERCGPAARSRTADGAPALDVAAGIRAICDRSSIRLHDTGTCTACSPRHWSHRARADGARQALVAWLEP